MAGIRTCDHESQVQRTNHYTTEPPLQSTFKFCLWTRVDNKIHGLLLATVKCIISTANDGIIQ